MKTILYATDCTRHATPALRYAYKLSEKLNARLIVLSVYDLPPVLVSTIRAPKHRSRMAADEHMMVLHNYCSRYLKDRMSADIVLDVVESPSISDGILKRCHALQPDLFIMGMKDEHTLRGYFSGNIANAILAECPCPVIMVPNQLRYRKLRTLVYATDFEERDLQAIQKLVKMAAPYDAEILVVHIPTKEEYAGMEQMEWFKELLNQQVDYGNIRFNMIFADSIQEGLGAYVQDVRADLLAMLQRDSGRSFFSKLLHRDQVKIMESRSKIPIMSFNERCLQSSL
ncbi:universal stress protein [Lentiprolixibacter aurantiacus]|uniref:Universal stress protein n=1 Tax=Lentiprolixibacter aurantiacus TaxID=2993939 RepID=A0AAE3SQ43_9FLAO|nr:universal stress protein [Lentiprolixibacter aurantiacus]MCX2720122.1 universal stress protein [Lentiprolixibacter aurantiacus]